MRKKCCFLCPFSYEFAIFCPHKKGKKKKHRRLIEDYIENVICHLSLFLSEVMASVYMHCNRYNGGSIPGDIVQTDTETTLRHIDPSWGFDRFPFFDLDRVCKVNQEKVVVEKLRRDQVRLYFDDFDELKMAVFVKYYEDSGYVLLTSSRSSMRWKKQLNEVYYNYSYSGKDANDKSLFQATDRKSS